MSVVAIHQPNYFPWLGYFYKMTQCDVFVFLDNAQFSKNSFINRNRIKTSQGVKWLTVPVHGKIDKSIRETKSAGTIWREKHLMTLRSAYGRAPYFMPIIKWLDHLLESEVHDNLADLNIGILRSIAGKLGVNCSFARSSTLGVEERGDERLIQLVKKVDGDVYLSGHGGKKYQEESKFEKGAVLLQYYNFTPFEYPQLWGAFVEGLSIIDVLFNCGFRGTAQALGIDSPRL